MDKEKTALLEHAARCRRTADQIDRHRGPAAKLRTMAAEYESRAAKLEDQTTYLNKSDENLGTVFVEDFDHGLGPRGFRASPARRACRRPDTRTGVRDRKA
jgi:hypothetical protein